MKKLRPQESSLDNSKRIPFLLLGLILSVLVIRAGDTLAIEHRFIYFPSPQLVATPKEIGLPFAEVWFGQEQRLHGWFVPGTTSTTFLWLHGNAGNISHRLDWLKRLHAHVGANVFIFDYPGYGLSQGQPSERTTYQAARSALAYLRTRADLDADRVVYYGKSLGGGVAVQLATEEPPHRLIVQSTFTSMTDLARLHYPFLPVGPWLRTRYASIDKIGRAEAPILIVHGERDDIVPLEQAERLYEAARQPKRLLVIPRAGHNDLLEVGGIRYLDVLREFAYGGPGP